jgi:hypothetical protein
MEVVEVVEGGGVQPKSMQGSVRQHLGEQGLLTNQQLSNHQAAMWVPIDIIG